MNVIRLAVLVLATMPSLAFADDRWYWATAQCKNEAEDNVYMFAAVVDITTEIDPDTDEPQHSKDAARYGFGNYVEATYAEDRCGEATVTAQNMYATNSFDTREDAEASLDDYIAREEAEGNDWLKIVRLDDYEDTSE